MGHHGVLRIVKLLMIRCFDNVLTSHVACMNIELANGRIIKLKYRDAHT